MGSQYQGDGANYPEDFTIPDDADPPTAAAVNVALEALGDRTECIRQIGLMRLMKQTFTATGTGGYIAAGSWTKPENMVGDEIELVGWGGGGGGGASGPAGLANGTDVYASGGAGGGSAPVARMRVDVSALIAPASVDVYIGGGGLGGQNAGDRGDDGGATLFDIAPPSITFPGGGGGGGGRSTTDAARLVMALGGSPSGTLHPALTAAERAWEPASGATNVVPPVQLGQGGHAGSPNTNHTYPGGRAVQFAAPTNSAVNGGSYGAKGADSGTRRGGGGGGGGAAGPGGSGASGGAGGAGNGAGAGGAGTNGNNAADGTGAGGGGAGSPGHGSTGLGAHARGGNGGCGQLTVYWWEKGVALP